MRIALCRLRVRAPSPLIPSLALRQVRITLGRLRLRGLTSWAALEAAVAEEWQPQLLAQLHRYVAGLHAAPLGGSLRTL